MTFWLHVVPARGSSYDLQLPQQTLTIGRSTRCDLVFEDEAVSRKHARLSILEGQLYIEDLKSHNGTWVNGDRVLNVRELAVGDVVKISGNLLSVRDSSSQNGSDAKSGAKSGENLFHQVFRSASGILGDHLEEEDTYANSEANLRRYADRIKMLNEVHRVLGRPITREDLLELILDRVFDYLRPEEGAIFMKREDGSLFAAATRARPDLESEIVFSQSLAKEVAEKGMAALVYDTKTDPRFSEANSILGVGIRSLVAAPLLDSGESMGMIVLDSRAGVRQFSEEDMELLVALASVAALRLRNLMLTEKDAEQLRDSNRELEAKVAERTRELEAINHELETLDGIVKTVNREMTLQGVLQTILDQVSLLFPQAETGGFLLWNPRQKVFQVAASRGYVHAELEKLVFTMEELQDFYQRHALEVHEGIFLGRHIRHGAIAHRGSAQTIPTSFLSMAVTLEGEPHGFLILENAVDSGAFTKTDGVRLEKIREHAISAVSKAHLLQELKEKNEAILETQGQLILQEKMASIGTLTAGIAHEIRNPLNFINNFAVVSEERFQELLQDWGPELRNSSAPENDTIKEILRDLQKNVSIIGQHGRRANQIVESMMELARGEEGQRQEIPLNDLVEEYTNLAYHGMQARNHRVRVRIRYSLDRNIDQVRVVPQDLGRVLINLVNNAMDSVWEKQAGLGAGFQPEILVSTEKEDKGFVIKIRDNGKGIPADKVQNIFNPFFTTKPTGQGNIGLGLSICYDVVVRAHGGEILVNSEPDDFSEFKLILPNGLPEKKT